jgi:type IV secretion system protein VirB10
MEGSDTTSLQRGAAAVAQDATSQSRLQRQFAWLIAGALGVAMLTWYYQRAFSASSTSAGASTSKSSQTADSTLPAVDFAGLRKSQAGGPPSADQTNPYRIGSVLGDPGISAPDELVREEPPYAPPPPSGAASPTPEQRRLSGEVFSRRASEQPGQDLVTLPADAETPGTVSASATSTPASLLAAQLLPTPIATAHATQLPTRRLLLPKGRFIDCTLHTAIDSTLPGMATCLTATDTFSDDGSVVLLERGTTLIGEVQSNVSQGQARVFVLWTEARTPTGVVVPLASPGTDALGRSGLPGKVNRHFWDRFGAAMLVSVLDGAVQGYAAREASGSTVVVNPSGTQDVMTEVLRSTVNIPPTIRIPHGARIQILAARDVDFRGVYQLTSR